MSRRKPLTPRVDRLESRQLLAANPLMAWEQPFALHFGYSTAGVKSAAEAPITNYHASPQAQTSTAHPKASGHLNLQPTHSKPAASPAKAANYVVSGHLHLPMTAPTHSKPAPKAAQAPAPKSKPLAGTVIHTASVTNPTIWISTGVNPAIQGGNLGTFVITSSEPTSIPVHVVVTFTGPNKLGDGLYTSYSSLLGSNVNGIVTGDVTLTSDDGVHGATATLYVDPSTNISTSPLDDGATAEISASSSGSCCCCCGGGVTPTFFPNSASLTIQNTGSVGITVNGSSSATTTGGNPGTPATFDVHYTGNPSHAITVQLDASGSTAIPNTDYTYFYCNRFFVTPWAGPHILTCVEDTHTAGS